MTGNHADSIALPHAAFPAAADTASSSGYWRFVSLLVSLGMLAFLCSQSLMTLREQGGRDYLPNVIVFSGFLAGTGAFVLAGMLSAIQGVRTSLSQKAGLVMLAILTCWSLVNGHYDSQYAIREALLSASGIGVWMAFLLVLPGRNRGFWVHFRGDLLAIYKLALVLQVFAIMLHLAGNKGLLRVNFSTSISLFILGWGMLDGNKKFVRWGMIGMLLFGFHSALQDQRETFLLPLEFFAFMLPIYFGRSLRARKQRISAKLTQLIAVLGLLIVLVPVVKFALPAKKQAVFSGANITENTRTLVLRDYLASDMVDPGNALFGKGVNGFYKSSLRNTAIGGKGSSTGIEIGYLQMIVNVGALYVVIMLLLGFSPALRGVLRSTSPLIIASGLWVLTKMVNMNIAAIPRTEYTWFLFWICIGAVTSKELAQWDAATPETVRS